MEQIGVSTLASPSAVSVAGAKISTGTSVTYSAFGCFGSSIVHSGAISMGFVDAPNGMSASIASTANVATEVSTPSKVAFSPPSDTSRSSMGDDNCNFSVGLAVSGNPSAFVNSISNKFASGELALPIPLSAALIDCISSSHFLTSSRASSNVIDFVAVESDMMRGIVYCCFSCWRCIMYYEVSSFQQTFWQYPKDLGRIGQLMYFLTRENVIDSE
mmetsp:Transcript_7921/g.19471  ORF Transcript_7921/g.19471 Transcript_7921/m.19471 type:complete len:216 (-) Transcript_7921:1465-2112(-)